MVNLHLHRRFTIISLTLRNNDTGQASVSSVFRLFFRTLTFLVPVLFSSETRNYSAVDPASGGMESVWTGLLWK